VGDLDLFISCVDVRGALAAQSRLTDCDGNADYELDEQRALANERTRIAADCMRLRNGPHWPGAGA